MFRDTTLVGHHVPVEFVTDRAPAMRSKSAWVVACCRHPRSGAVGEIDVDHGLSYACGKTYSSIALGV